MPVFAFLAPAPGSGGSSALVVVALQIAALIGIFWFLLLRPQRQQQAKHAEMLKGLKRGDEVVTTGGIVGRVIHLKETLITIESGESRLVVERERIAKVNVPQAAPEPAAK
ncbi:MAG TPA: preprotein translocase subunit YajC [Gemmatimonadales bacterium]|jgi:preprotein translocase subunit YajC